MAFIPTANCVQARLMYQGDAGVVAENVFWNATETTPTEADLEEIGIAWQDWADTSFPVMATPNWRIVGVNLRAMNEEEGISIYYDTGFPVVGSVAEANVALQVSYTVTWNTGLVGRSARGRSYGVGLPQSYIVDNNRLNDAGRLSLQVKWANILTVMNAAAHAIQVVSFQEGGVPRAAGRKLPILSSNVRFPLATQRRRLT